MTHSDSRPKSEPVRAGSTTNRVRSTPPEEVGMRKISRARLVAYGVAVPATAVTVLMRLFVVPDVADERGRYIAFVPAVVIAAYLGGLWPGLLATLLSVGALDYFFIEPRYSFWIQGSVDD